MKIEVDGLKEIQAALRELGEPKAVRTTLRAALRRAAQPMLEAARNAVPVDQGNLKRSIKFAAAKGEKLDSPEFGIVIGIDANEQPAMYYPREKPRKAKTRRFRSGRVPFVGSMWRDPGVAGTGPIVEFGTPTKAARPFMRPAYDYEGDATIQRFAEAAWIEIAKTAARIAKGRGGG